MRSVDVDGIGRVAVQHVLDVHQQKLLVLLFVVKPQPDELGRVGVALVDQRVHRVVDIDRMLAFYRQNAGLAPKAKGYGGWDGDNRNLTGHIAEATSIRDELARIVPLRAESDPQIALERVAVAFWRNRDTLPSLALIPLSYGCDDRRSIKTIRVAPRDHRRESRGTSHPSGSPPGVAPAAPERRTGRLRPRGRQKGHFAGESLPWPRAFPRRPMFNLWGSRSCAT